MLFERWDAWRRRRAEAYLALSVQQRWRKHQIRRIATLVTLPGLVLGVGSLTAAYGSGLLSHSSAPVCTPTVVPAPARTSFGVDVLNATGTGGLATTVSRELARRGFAVKGASSAPDGTYIRSSAVVQYGPAALDQALLVAKQVSGARLFNDGRTGTGVSLIIGSGFTTLVPAPAPEPPRPSQIVVNVYNTTFRPGLATTIQKELVARDFRPGKVGNDPDGAFLPDGVALIRYGPDADLAAKRLAEHVPLAVLTPIARGGLTLDLVLGNKFTDLTPASAVPPLPPIPTGPTETVARPCQ